MSVTIRMSGPGHPIKLRESALVAGLTILGLCGWQGVPLPSIGLKIRTTCLTVKDLTRVRRSLADPDTHLRLQSEALQHEVDTYCYNLLIAERVGEQV